MSSVRIRRGRDANGIVRSWVEDEQPKEARVSKLQAELEFLEQVRRNRDARDENVVLGEEVRRKPHTEGEPVTTAGRAYLASLWINVPPVESRDGPGYVAKATRRAYEDDLNAILAIEDEAFEDGMRTADGTPEFRGFGYEAAADPPKGEADGLRAAMLDADLHGPLCPPHSNGCEDSVREIIDAALAETCDYKFDFTDERCALPYGHEKAHLTKGAVKMLATPPASEWKGPEYAAAMPGATPPDPSGLTSASGRCDVIVNNGMGEPTECGKTLPCNYHTPPASGPLDVDAIWEHVRLEHGCTHPIFFARLTADAENLVEPLGEKMYFALANLAEQGYQQQYNGRPSCPFCDNFIDGEESHTDGCILMSYLTEPQGHGTMSNYDKEAAEEGPTRKARRPDSV